MTRKAADFKLDPAQVVAIDALVNGKTITGAAEAAGVDRTTLHRWLKHDFEFQASPNRAKGDLKLALQAKTLKIAQKAMDVVEQALDKGDVRIAALVLKVIGRTLAEMPIGREGAGDLEQERLFGFTRGRSG